VKESIGGTFTFQLVIIFILIFVSFVTLTINYTRTYAIKNEVLSFIEKNEGLTDKPGGAIELINNYLTYNNYATMGVCDEDHYGVNNLTINSYEKVVKGEKYYYCVKKVNNASATHPHRVYYDIVVFFRFNIPVMGDIFSFRATGTTNDIMTPADNLGVEGG